MIENTPFKINPYPYQLEGIKYGLKKNKFLLGDEQGLGKTKQALEIAIFRREEIKRCLIICGVNGLKYNWISEIQKHTDEQAKILGSRINKNGKLVEGTLKVRLENISNLGDEFFLITNIESLRSDEIRNDKDCKIIIGTIDSLGTGYTLTAASTVIFTDNPWTSAKKYKPRTVRTESALTIVSTLSPYFLRTQ